MDSATYLTIVGTALGIIAGVAPVIWPSSKWAAWLFLAGAIIALIAASVSYLSTNYAARLDQLRQGVLLLPIGLCAGLVFAWLVLGLYPRPAPLSLDDLIASYLHDRTIYISDLARVNSVVRNKTFERVTFLGPAMVVFIGGNTIADNTIETDSSDAAFLEVPSATKTIGAIGFEKCIIKDSTFQRIQFMGTKQQLDHFKAGLKH